MSAILGRVLAHLWQRNQFTLADELTIHMGKLSDENDRLRAERDLLMHEFERLLEHGPDRCDVLTTIEDTIAKLRTP